MTPKTWQDTCYSRWASLTYDFLSKSLSQDGGGGWGESDPTQHYRKHANIRWGKYIQCYMKPTNIRYIHQLDHGTDAYRQVPG
jgi:hypothetical protein